MNDRFGLDLPALPLVLCGTPPGLERILMQEGIPVARVSEAHPLAFNRGRFVLVDGRSAAARVRPMLSAGHALIDVDDLRGGEPADPFAGLVDLRASRRAWEIGGYRLVERVSARPKAEIRRRLIGRLRARVERLGGLWARVGAFPHPYRSAVNFRADLDEPEPADYGRYARARRPLDDCSTHFVNTRAYARFPAILADLAGLDAQSHGHHHVVYRDRAANRRNVARAHELLAAAGIEPVGFAAPEGRWNAGLDGVLEEFGYEYGSDFGVERDDLPSFPWLGGRFSTVLQVPVHPICEGLFLDAGAPDGRAAADHLAGVVRAKLAAGEPAFVYGHPERRLGRHPEILGAIAAAAASGSESGLTWRATLTAFARWWRWRATRSWSLMDRGAGRYEVVFDDWDARHPIALEVLRGGHVAAIPLVGPRRAFSIDGLAYERRRPPAELPGPSAARPGRGLRLAIREAIDYETVTPIDELPEGTIADRLRKRLRRWRAGSAAGGGA